MKLKDLPVGGCYKRSKWPSSLMFAWDENSGYYAYVDTITTEGAISITTEGVITFKRAYNSTNAGQKSKVGEQILNGSDLECVVLPLSNGHNKNIKIKEVKMDKNYIGSYGLVECVYVDTIKEDISVPEGINNTYTFKIDLSLHKKIKVDDVVVVDGRNGLGICKIDKVYKLKLRQETMEAANRAKAWVVNKVDVKAHLDREEKTERRKFIEMELEERKKAVEEKAVWKFLADNDKEAAKLLEELEGLQ